DVCSSDLALARDRDLLAARRAIDDVSTVVAQVSDAHFSHSPTVSRVIRQRLKWADRLMGHIPTAPRPPVAHLCWTGGRKPPCRASPGAVGRAERAPAGGCDAR